MNKSVQLTAFIFLLLPISVIGDEFRKFVNLSCSEDLPFFSARTVEYWNPDYKGMEKNNLLKNSKELSETPYECNITEKVKIKVVGECSSYGKPCQPGNGPTSENIFITINGRPLISTDPLTASQDKGVISYSGSPFQSVTKYVEVSANTKLYKSLHIINALYCDETTVGGKQDRRYRDSGHKEITYENIKTKCTRLKYYCSNEQCLTSVFKSDK